MFLFPVDSAFLPVIEMFKKESPTSSKHYDLTVQVNAYLDIQG